MNQPRLPRKRNPRTDRPAAAPARRTESDNGEQPKGPALDRHGIQSRVAA